jgi:hypothetical protein
MARKKYTPKNKLQNLKASIDERIKRLAEMTDEARISNEMQTWLATMAKFHSYSQNNLWLIAIQRPDATQVAGYTKWQEFGRHVKKGESGIAILAPVIYRQDPDDPESPTVLKGFRVVYVFDVNQTEGDPLPEAPNWKSPARIASLQDALIDFAKAQGIEVEETDLSGETQGVSAGGTIILDQVSGTKTLVHEIAHELLHRDAGLSLRRAIKELEAEAVAYVVAAHFEIPDLASPNYLALWEADSEKIMERMERIRQASAQIINAIEPALSED